MKVYLQLFALLGVCLSKADAQTPNLDSLQNLLSKPMQDSVRGYVLDELSYEWFYNSLDSSLFYGQEAYQIFQYIDNQKGQARASTSIAVAFHYKNEWDSAKYYYENSLAIKIELNDEIGQAGSLNNLGVFYMDFGKLDEATAHFLTSLEFKETLGDTLGVASGNVNLGLVYRKQGNNTKAIEYYEKALNTYMNSGVDRHLPTIYLNLGALHNYSEEYDQGLNYNLKALGVSKKLQSRRYIGESYVNLSDSYLGLNRSDSSLYFTESAIQIFQKISDTLNLAHALNSASSLYLSKGNYSKSLTYSLDLERLNEQLNNNDIKASNALNFSKAYASLGRMSKAYFYLNISYDLRDSLLNKSMNKSINELTTKFETEKKERKIVELELDKNENVLALVSSKNQRNIFILVTLSIALFSVFLFLLVRSKSRTNRIVTKSLEERETLLKEIHHRVKNNLQIISSLLNIQAAHLKDGTAKDAVREGQNRVKSMALIHEKLYQNDNLSGVSVDEYIANLVRNLFNSFGVDEEKISSELKIEALKLDIDTLIPLGLILNELITNSLKYAFKDQGTIRLTLSHQQDELRFQIEDDGIGMDESTLETTNSYGWKMIQSLSRKLKAEITIDATAGTKITLNIKNFKLVA